MYVQIMYRGQREGSGFERALSPVVDFCRHGLIHLVPLSPIRARRIAWTATHRKLPIRLAVFCSFSFSWYTMNDLDSMLGLPVILPSKDQMKAHPGILDPLLFFYIRQHVGRSSASASLYFGLDTER